MCLPETSITDLQISLPSAAHSPLWIRHYSRHEFLESKKTFPQQHKLLIQNGIATLQRKPEEKFKDFKSGCVT